MVTTKSKYKIFGGLLLLSLINIIWFPITWKIILILDEKISNTSYQWETSDFVFSIFVIFLQLLFLYILMKECRFIKLDHEKIVFINPVLPFIRKTKYFSEYDYKQTVREYSRTGYYEATWLIRNGKLQDRISSFYYSNYKEIKGNIKIENRGRLKINEFKQIGCLFGMKI
ncbi:MAG TPA: hypothetical protein VLZ83_13680 [Edaphocola sp.]|nr:hypothetical protein [Edaphocola sp.]